MIPKAVWASLTAIAAIVSGAWAVDARFQVRATAEHEHELLAADQENGRLNTELELIKLEIKLLSDKQQRTVDEQNRLDYLKQRRAIIEARLLETAKKA